MSKKLETLGLVEVTSQRQADNGTICFHDPVTGCDYMSYESGYVRRAYKTTSYIGRGYQAIYQLNKTRKVTQVSEWSGREYECVERILEPNPDARIDMIARGVINYRKNQVK